MWDKLAGRKNTDSPRTSGYCISVEIPADQRDSRISDLFKLVLGNIPGGVSQATIWYESGAVTGLRIDNHWSIRRITTTQGKYLILAVYLTTQAMLESTARQQMANLLYLIPPSDLTFIPIDAGDNTPITLRSHPEVTFTKSLFA